MNASAVALAQAVVLATLLLKATANTKSMQTSAVIAAHVQQVAP
jgi:hypothetical protein